MKIISGIYYIKNKINEKIYIGSSKNIYNRKSQHYSELRGNYHENIFLQRSWNKYGEENFEFGILEEVEDIDELYTREQFYIDKYYDKGNMCYNINPLASKPPTSSIRCALYDKNGLLLQTFESIRSCSEFLKLDESWINSSCNKDSSLISSKYMIRKILNGNIEKTIKPYQPNNYKEIYLLDNNDNIANIFYDIPSLSMYLNKNKLKTEETKIASCLHVIHKYKGLKIIYKDDYDKFNGYPNLALKVQKYILKYNFKGELLEVIENKYGLKFTGTKADNCKINTRLYLLGRSSMRVFEEKYIYLRSDYILENIKTGVTTYLLINVHTNEEKEFFKQKDLIKFLNISKSIYERYFYSNKIYDDTYKFIKRYY